MLDTDLILQALRDRGHTCVKAISIPENAGEFEFMVDDKLLTLSQVRELLEAEVPR